MSDFLRLGPKKTGGELAVEAGTRSQNILKELLFMKKYIMNPCHSLEGLNSSRVTMFPVPGQFSEQCRVPLVLHCHKPGRSALVDFAVLTKSNDVVLLSVKSQCSNGSAEEKLEYEYQQLIATEYPAAMLVLGPVKGRDAKTGWNGHVLEEIWERARHYGSGRVFLFRTVERVGAWIDAGMPVAGRGIRSSEIFSQFCDREP